MSALSKILLVAVSLFSLESLAWGRACFYEGANYTGRSFCLEAGQVNQNLNGFFNDMISSISVDGDLEVRVYSDSDYRGNELLVTNHISDMSRIGGFWNDRVSSIVVDYNRGPGRPERPGRPPGPVRPGPRPDPYPGNPGRPGPGGGMACFYEHDNFGGESFCLREGEEMYNLNGPWNDRISSMRIQGNVVVTLFVNAGYSGMVGQFTRDEYSFNRFGGNDTVSSIRVQRLR